MQKLIWIKLNKNDFDSLTQDVYKNLNNDEFITTVDRNDYDLKNAKRFLLKITTHEISQKEAVKLNSGLIIPDIVALEKSKSKGKDKKNNILNVLSNLEPVVTGVYSHYCNKPESEESIARKESS